MPTLYVICPSESYFPGIEAWIVDGWSMLPAVHQAAGWVYDLSRADKNNTFVPLIVYSRIAKNVGPVLILGSIKREPIAVLSTKLMTKCVINHVRDLQNTEGLREAIVRTLDRHANGEPHVPLRLAATLQILWKLQKGDYWGGGSKNKAFIWASDLPKGRGVTDVIAPHALMVANELHLKGLLQSKKSQGDLKYALNKVHLQTMHAIFRSDWEKVPEGLTTWLLNNEMHALRTEIEPAIAGWVFGTHTSDLGFEGKA